MSGGARDRPVAGLTFLAFIMVRAMECDPPHPALLSVKPTLVRVADPDLELFDLGVRQPTHVSDVAVHRIVPRNCGARRCALH